MKALTRVVIVALLAVMVGAIPATAAPNVVIFEEGFESGNLSAWDNVNTNRYAITSNPAEVLTGNYALEGTIPQGDGWG